MGFKDNVEWLADGYFTALERSLNLWGFGPLAREGSAESSSENSPSTSGGPVHIEGDLVQGEQHNHYHYYGEGQPGQENGPGGGGGGGGEGGGGEGNDALADILGIVGAFASGPLGVFAAILSQMMRDQPPISSSTFGMSSHGPLTARR